MKKLVIFDLDNTLLNGDSDRNWGEFLSEKRIVNDDYLLRSEQFYNNYYEGSLDIDGFLDFCLEPLKNNEMDLLLELRVEFIERKIKPIVLPAALTRVQEEMQDNMVIIATATNDFVTKPIADLFGVQYQTTLLIFKGNKEVYRSIGETTEDLIYEALKASI